MGWSRSKKESIKSSEENYEGESIQENKLRETKTGIEDDLKKFKSEVAKSSG